MTEPPGATDSATFWEQVYQQRARPSDGQPNPILARITASLTPGSALDLGCAVGDNTIWLAQHGWDATGVDISPTALERARARAAELHVMDRIDFQQHDLAQSFPTGAFDLVYALYLQSPIEFGRDQVLRRAAQAVTAGGRLLVVVHGSHRPWGWDQEPHTRFPTPAEQLASLQLPANEWTIETNDTSYRQVTGPQGQSATVTDIVVRSPRAC